MSCYSDVDGCKIKCSWQEWENIMASFVFPKINKEFFFLNTQGHSANNKANNSIFSFLMIKASEKTTYFMKEMVKSSKTLHKMLFLSLIVNQ